MRGDTVTAVQWAQKNQGELLKSCTFRTEQARMILARVWIQQQRYDDTIKLLSSLRHCAKRDNRVLHIVQSYILEAICQQAAGHHGLSSAAMNTALSLAQPCALQRVFINEGENIVVLLQRALEHNIASGYTKSLLKSCAQTKQQALFTGKGILIEPLSPREVEILQLVGDGLRNKDIASTLTISLSTVKAHIYNIFSKLQTGSRTEAVSKGRALGIL